MPCCMRHMFMSFVSAKLYADLLQFWLASPIFNFLAREFMSKTPNVIRLWDWASRDSSAVHYMYLSSSTEQCHVLMYRLQCHPVSYILPLKNLRTCSGKSSLCNLQSISITSSCSRNSSTTRQVSSCPDIPPEASHDSWWPAGGESGHDGGLERSWI